MVEQVTLTQVAERAGVAVSTVSRALNAAASAVPISKATVERVREAAEELGYVPSAAGRMLRTGRSRTIGVLAWHPQAYLHVGQPGFVAEILSGIMTTAIERGYHVSLLTGWDAGPADPGPLADFGLADGVLLVDRDLEQDRRCANALRRCQKPVVHVLEYPDDTDEAHASTPDDEAGGVLATRALLDAGHGRIAFAKYRDHTRIYDRRQAGWAAALQEAGIAPRGEWVIDDPGSSSALANANVTAVVCGNAPIASHLQQTADAAGLRVPEDLSIVCFDHFDSAGQAALCPFAAVAHPLAQTVGRGVGMLIDLIEDETPAAKHARSSYTFHHGPTIAPPRK